MRNDPILFEQLPAGRRSLRIAIVTETYPPEVNGVAMTVGRFVSGLHQLQHEVQLVRPRQDSADRAGSGERFQEVLQRGIPIPRYPALKMGLPAKQALTRLWSVKRPDVVHIVTEGPLGWSAVQAARKLRLPISSDFHTNFHAYSRHYGIGWLKTPIAAYLRKFHNGTHCTMVPTGAMRDELIEMGFRNLRVVARGVDVSLFDPARRSETLRQSWGAGPSDPVALYVGRLAAEKNLSAVVAAFEAMRMRCKNARFVLVGDGPEAPSLAAKHPNYVFAGLRIGEDLATHYASGDIFLFPSLTETYGNVTVEAMASGLAVVAYDYAAAAEHIRHGDNGLLADYANLGDCVRHAAELITDAQRIATYGARARATALGLDWNRVVRELESVFMAVADPHAQAVDFPG